MTNIVLVLIIVAVAWIVVVWVLSSVPGTPHSQSPGVTGATLQSRTDEGLQRFIDHGMRVRAWNAVAVAFLAGLTVGLASRRWFHFRPLDIGAIVAGVALFKWSDYRMCCVDRWDVIGPILLGAIIFVIAGARRTKPPNSAVAADFGPPPA